MTMCTIGAKMHNSILGLYYGGDFKGFLNSRIQWLDTVQVMIMHPGGCS